MLQPLQLQDVSVRYANEIAELRDFLTKADHPPLDTAGTLAGVATRLRDDRAYRRDLTSHVWAVIFERDRNVSYSELLGMLAIAAAGQRFAAEADETDAHSLLRFLMETRRSFDVVSEPRKTAPVPWPAAPATAPILTATPNPALAHVPITLRRLEPVTTLDDEEEEVSEDRRPVILIAVACLLVAILAGVWWHYKSAADRNAAAALAARSTAATTAESNSENTNRPAVEERSQPLHTLPPSPTARSSSRAIAPPVTASSSHSVPLSTPSPKGNPGTSNIASPSLPTDASSKRPVSAPTPSNPSVTTRDESADNDPPPFHLLRRQPVAPSSGSSNNSNPIAEPRTVTTPTVVADSRVGTPNVSRGGSIRPTSLGAMAANVMYSPVPSYPVAASTAHVQGEVKLEAEVDRDGNVTSARVISGPPLLREAAADAVEHWRYRPYLYGGKPISMSALVVMDFKLP